MNLREDRINTAMKPLGGSHPPDYCIGEDLTQDDLDDLFEIFVNGTNNALITNKPHQVVWRLLMRLTRAEVREENLERQLAKLRTENRLLKQVLVSTSEPDEL